MKGLQHDVSGSSSDSNARDEKKQFTYFTYYLFDCNIIHLIMDSKGPEMSSYKSFILTS